MFPSGQKARRIIIQFFFFPVVYFITMGFLPKYTALFWCFALIFGVCGGFFLSQVVEDDVGLAGDPGNVFGFVVSFGICATLFVMGLIAYKQHHKVILITHWWFSCSSNTFLS